MHQLLIKLGVEEADEMFPMDGDMIMTDPAKVRDDLVKKVIREVTSNCGYAELKSIDKRIYHKCFDQVMETDAHGDEFTQIAEMECTMEDGLKVNFRFVYCA